MSGTSTPQGILALFPKPPEDEGVLESGRLVLALDAVQDPQNVGALVRAAAGFGADAVVVGPGSAHPFGDRAVRASAGAVFRLPVFEIQDWSAELHKRGYLLAVADARGGEEATAYVWEGRWAIVVGNEGHGPTVQGERRLTMVLRRGVESLNVALAGAVLLREVAKLLLPAETGQ